MTLAGPESAAAVAGQVRAMARVVLDDWGFVDGQVARLDDAVARDDVHTFMAYSREFVAIARLVLHTDQD